MLRPKLNRVWTSSNAVLRRDPGDVKYLQGWVSEIPTYQVLNYLQYKVDTTLLALAERGVFEWGTDIQYRLGSVVWDETDSKIYVAKVASPNKTTKPSSNLTQWEASSIQVSRASYDAIVAKINAHIADITSNPHKLTAGMLDAYNKTELDNIVAQYRAIVLAHASDKNNPHQLTATGIGAVPITGGAYTGDVTFQAGVYFDVAKSNKLSTANGFFLQSAAAMLGIDSTGKPVAGASSTTLSPLVTEQTFPALKAAQEPKYAVPVPDLQLDLMNSIDLRYGATTVDSGSYNPVYDAASGAISFDNTATQSIIANSLPVSGSNSGTIAIDLKYDSVVSGSSDFVAHIGASSLYIRFRADGYVYEGVGGTTPSVINKVITNPTSWHRFVVTYGDGFSRIYIDGILVNETATTGTADVATWYKVEGMNVTNIANRVGVKAKNARVWYNQVLTPEQISTL